MEWTLLAEQILNGIQFGVLLFLLAAGLTLTFGIMDLVNLAHGSMYMLGAFVGATIFLWTGSFIAALLLAVPIVAGIGILTEVTTLRTLYQRHHLDQVLATFGLILFFNQLVQIVWPLDGLTVPFPKYLSSTVPLILGIEYPVYRLMIIGAGIVVAVGMWLLVAKTKLGMLIRAGASDSEMIYALGINIRLLFTLVFGLGTALGALAGVLMAPILGANSGMGEQIIIVAFVVIVIGGIGSVRGSLIAALITGLIDTLGRSFLDVILALFVPSTAAEAAAPAISSMLIYIFMACILFFKPKGLFGGQTT